MSNNDFYIGWMPKAPGSFARHTKKVIIALLILAVTVGVLLATAQKKFSTGQFEFGRLTNITGVYFKEPVPAIKVMSGKDLLGRASYITIPLIGYGKFGAGGIILDLEKEKHLDLVKKEITLKGTLLYNDGKLLMQIDAADDPLVSVNKAAGENILPLQKELGEQTILGEIVDPKCFFGVMKPGEGKPHKDCAIRCISGGIPPVLKVINNEGEANYYLLMGAQGEKMNQAVKEFVAAPVAVKAKVVKYDDWVILYVTDKKSISPVSARQLIKPGSQTIGCIAPCLK
ncbi:hypothetical protein FAM09_23145 [Niastella caeni]|uniref:Uncharacterized protein n=1 Tax=Niastella caeni TaxID=2569763 RepID=A0A4S8HPG0_9BACT|nr:hypothetical protein [Niastella caeni]THU34892.1 hypothetical protein FAM09_23145 [Niastella caeni]